MIPAGDRARKRARILVAAVIRRQAAAQRFAALRLRRAVVAKLLPEEHPHRLGHVHAGFALFLREQACVALLGGDRAHARDLVREALPHEARTRAYLAQPGTISAAEATLRVLASLAAALPHRVAA